MSASSDSFDDQGPSRAARLPRSARRAQLLEAAQSVFVDNGYHAAGMDEIAERAGVSKPVLYQHFPSKLELYLALLDQANERILELVTRALDSTQDNKARVEATIAAYFEFVSAEDAPFRLVFESDLTNEAEVAKRLRRVEEETADAVAEIIRTSAGVPGDVALLLSTGIVGMAQTSARFWLAQGQKIPIAEAARLVAALAWRGVGVFPKAEDRVGEND